MDPTWGRAAAASGALQRTGGGATMGIGEHFDGVKQHWARNFAFLDYFKKVYGRAEPLPKWSDADVEEFIASDPVYGPQLLLQLKALQESRKFALGGALGGATHLGGVAFKYSKAPHGVLLATGFGAITGAVLGAEVAEHWYQLYKVDKQGANLRFIYWWEDKVSEVADEFKLQAETLNLAVSYVDRFLTMNVVTRDKLQLLGVTALLVAAKYEEIESSKMKVNKYTDITNNTYTKQQVVNMEADLLKSLNFLTRGPSVTTFLLRFIASCCGGNRTSSKKLESMCSYLAELSLLDYDCISYLPAVVVAACLFVARFTICPKTHPWNLTLQHNTGYKAFDLQNSIFTVLKEHFLTVTSLTLSDDGQTLLSAGRDKLTSLQKDWMMVEITRMQISTSSKTHFQELVKRAS